MSRARSWLSQFPPALRELATVRLAGSIGAGGVLYLTPMVFHQEAFSAGSVTGGIAMAAVAGSLARLGCGTLLDRRVNCSVPVLIGAAVALLGDAVLLGARGFGGYLVGQLLLGIALGLYWPAIELAVPLSCAPLASARAFALVRSADALGIASGALVGALLAATGRLRGIYLVDMACLGIMALLLLRRPLPDPRPRDLLAHPTPWRQWLPPLLPLLAIALLATAMGPLMQSALPLDLVRGGLEREALPESLGALLIGLQLGLLVLLQWPVGRALAQRPVSRGLGLSFRCFALGCLLLALLRLHPVGGGAADRGPVSPRPRPGGLPAHRHRGGGGGEPDRTSGTGHGPVFPVFRDQLLRGAPGGGPAAGSPGPWRRPVAADGGGMPAGAGPGGSAGPPTAAGRFRLKGRNHRRINPGRRRAPGAGLPEAGLAASTQASWGRGSVPYSQSS